MNMTIMAPVPAFDAIALRARGEAHARLSPQQRARLGLAADAVGGEVAPPQAGGSALPSPTRFGFRVIDK